MLRGTNLPAVSAYNQALVLDFIRRSEGLSRVELAERTGLSAQTLSNVTRRLIGEGFVREAGKVGSGPGKPRTLLQLESTARYAVGVHLDPSVLTTVLLDLGGGVVGNRRVDADPSMRPQEAVEALAADVADLIDSLAIAPDRVSGIGLAAPGPIDAARGRMYSPPLLEQWHDVAIGEELAKATGHQVIVEKDVTAAIIAETWLSEPRKRANVMFFYYGTGVGAGFSFGGTVVRGVSSNAGEIGHLIVDPDGPLCRCGRRGCLGDSVAPRRLLVEAADRRVPGVRPADRGPDLMEHWQRFVEAVLCGDTAACAIADTLARRFARAIGTISAVLDLDSVVFGGPYWEPIGEYLLDRVAAFMAADPASMTVHPVAFSTSSLGADVAAIGAGCVVLDRAHSARADDLLIES